MWKPYILKVIPVTHYRYSIWNNTSGNIWESCTSRSASLMLYTGYICGYIVVWYAKKRYGTVRDVVADSHAICHLIVLSLDQPGSLIMRGAYMYIWHVHVFSLHVWFNTAFFSHTLKSGSFPRIEGASGNVSEGFTFTVNWLMRKSVLCAGALQTKTMTYHCTP